MINHQMRLEEERKFWDRHAENVWRDVQDFRMPNLASFEELCKSISYLGPVIEFVGSVRDKCVLDLACGDGWLSWSLAKSGAVVNGCDISPRSIEVATQIARANGLESRVRFDTMICEKLAYEDGQFDLVVMHAALHHCDINKTRNEIYRVLKKGGKAVLIEDYAYNPLMNLYRRLTPHRHTETEEALTDHDLRLIVTGFAEHSFEHFGIVDLIETRQERWLQIMKPVVRLVDSCLYRMFPRIRKYSKLVEIFLVK